MGMIIRSFTDNCETPLGFIRTQETCELYGSHPETTELLTQWLKTNTLPIEVETLLVGAIFTSFW
jgi:hypothetical protein